MPIPQVDEPVEIRAYDARWAEVFRNEAMRLHAQLGSIAVGIEHIGSTAVPGLRGKPVVDIMIGVRARDLRIETVRPMLSDYDCFGEAGVPGRVYFGKRTPEGINVHIVEHSGTHWHDNLLLRDYLRAHPDEADRYGMAKEEIVGRGICTLVAYSEAKRGVIKELLSRAHSWALHGARSS